MRTSGSDANALVADGYDDLIYLKEVLQKREKNLFHRLTVEL